MQGTSYITTFRASGDPARRANLEAVLAWLAPLGLGEIIVMEQDVAPSLPPGLGGARVVFAYNPGPFNKGWGLNVGARFSRLPLLAFGDGDLICPGLPEAVASCRVGAPVVRAFDKVIDLDAAASAAVRAAPHQPAGLAGTERATQGEYAPLCGGLVLFQRALFQLLGGWDERFLGWGGEDDAMSVKVARAGVPARLVNRPALHLHHRRPRGKAAANPHYRDNLAVLAELRALSDVALKRLCEVSGQLAGNQQMHRPVGERA